jgi:hypothetical protein
MPRMPEQTFRSYDETQDEEFYSVPRLVTHGNAYKYKTACAEVPPSADRGRHRVGVDGGLNHLTNTRRSNPSLRNGACR